MVVEILESCMVTPPSGVTPKKAVWLSNLDHQFREHTPMVFVYRQPTPNPKDFFSPEMLKAALSKALVPFYPLAGRLAPDGTGRMEIHCTGDGVLFVTARTDATLDDMGDFAPSDELRQMLVPSAEGGNHAGVLFMVQVTFFKCGAVCLGTAIHHMTTDGRGFTGFLNTWAAIVTGDDSEDAMPRPFVDRSLLRARSPPAVHFDHTGYTLPHGGGKPSKPNVRFVSAIIKICKHQVEALKRCAASVKGKKVSTYIAVSAHVWRCMCKARGLTGTDTTRLRTPADVRSRVRPPLPDGYLGNALVCTTAVAKVEDVVSGPLHVTAAKVAEATDRLTDEYIRSQVDYMEQSKSYQQGIGRWAIPDANVYVVSWLGVPYPEVDFGWGRPAFIGRATMRIGGAVCLVPRKKGGDGGLNVVVNIEPDRLATFKELFYADLNCYSQVSRIRVFDRHVAKHSRL